MGRGATGFLVACALWSGALLLAAVEAGQADAPDDVGSIDAPPLDLPRGHDAARVEGRRDPLALAEAEPGDDDDVPSFDDELDRRGWDDPFLDDDEAEPEPPPLDDEPVFIDDLDEWLGAPGEE